MISAEKAIARGRLMIGFGAFCAFMPMAGMIILPVFLNFSAYVAVPLSLIGMIVVMLVGFTIAGKQWLTWAYINVDDVRELEKGQMLSGFGAYSWTDLEKKQTETYKFIAQRFKQYEFVDDINVPFETKIYNRKFYQSSYLILGIFFMSIGILMLVGGFYLYGLPWVTIFGGVWYKRYSKMSSAEPQLILSNDGINIGGYFTNWANISNEHVIQDEFSYLAFERNGVKESVDIDKLRISNRHLNHLLHVYRSRNELLCSNAT